MHEREAFRAIFSFGGTLESLDAAQVSNLQAAIGNARAFASEVLAKLRRNVVPSLEVGVA
jgi:chromosome partitioning protein